MSSSDHAQHRLFVCWALTNPDNGDAVSRLARAVENQKDIPGVLSIEQGRRTPQVDWEGPQYDFDYAMSLTFDNFESARNYVPHPIHEALVELILQIGSNIQGHWFDL